MAFSRRRLLKRARELFDEKQLVKRLIDDVGISGNVVGKALRLQRIAVSPVGYLRRNAKAKRIAMSSAYSDFIDPENGYRLFSQNDLPGIMNAVSAADHIFQERKEAPRHEESKPFFANICDERALVEHPDLLTFARSRAVFEIATSYLKTLPKLSALGVFYSPPNETLAKSQMWHTDHEDFCQIKCFINVHDVSLENGPFTFIPAAKSDRIRRAIGHRWRSDRVGDEEILSHCNDADIISLAGNAGSGAFVDTSRCLHFGSRSRGGHRLVIMFQYTRTPDLNVGIPKSSRDQFNLLADH